MKKIYSLIFVSVLFFSSLFAADFKLVDFTGGISSGYPFYGNSEAKTAISNIDNPNRIIIGTFANLNINPVKYGTFYVGAEVLADFCWNSDASATFFNVDFPIGLKIYPDLGGFNFGLAYTLGFCGMMINNEEGDDLKDSSPWGNGVKFTVEYDFYKTGKSKLLPAIGLAWNIMPRGHKKYDNIITIQLSKHF